MKFQGCDSKIQPQPSTPPPSAVLPYIVITPLAYRHLTAKEFACRREAIRVALGANLVRREKSPDGGNWGATHQSVSTDYSCFAGLPCLNAAIPVAERIENQFDAVGDPQLLEDSIDIVPHGMLFHLQPLADFPVLQAVGDQPNHFLFARRQ